MLVTPRDTQLGECGASGLRKVRPRTVSKARSTIARSDGVSLPNIIVSHF